MGSVKVYIKPFQEDGTYEADYIEVSKYVSRVGGIKIDADSLDFQLGLFRSSSVAITLNNRDGKFSDVDALESMFAYTRANSLVKITWDMECEASLFGWAIAGEAIAGEEVTVFEGLLNDDGFREDAMTEVVEFQVLGFESLLDRVEVPFDSINVGDSIQDLLYACLNQSPITDYLTVNIANINPGTDQDPDNLDSAENMSVKAFIDLLLTVSNSVCFVRDGAFHVTNRDPSASVMATFYGQASANGIENIMSVENITNGINRCFNYFYWRETNTTQKNNASILKHKVRKKEIDLDIFTDVAKQGTLLENLLNEFVLPKKEFEITVPLTYEVLELELFDKISVDYPTVFVPTPGFELPICGIAVCGEAVLPIGLWSLTVDPDDEWKILSKEIDVVGEKVMMKVRAV